METAKHLPGVGALIHTSWRRYKANWISSLFLMLLAAMLGAIVMMIGSTFFKWWDTVREVFIPMAISAIAFFYVFGVFLVMRRRECPREVDDVS